MSDDCQCVIKHVDGVNSPNIWAIFSRSSDAVLIKSSVDTITLWNVHTGRCLSTMIDQQRHNYSTKYFYNGHRLVVSFLNDDITIVDPFTWICLHTLHTAQSGQCFDLSPDGSHLAVGTWRATVNIWHVSTNTRVRTIELPRSSWDCMYSSDGSLLATALYDRIIKVWDLNRGVCIYTCQTEGYMTAGVFSPRDVALLAVRSNNTIALWNVRTGVRLNTLVGHRLYVNECKFFSDGSHLVTTSCDNTIRIWNIRTGICGRVIQTTTVLHCDISADDSVLVTYDHRTAHIWRVPVLLRNNVKLLLMIMIGYRHPRWWLPTELWDWLTMQWCY